MWKFTESLPELFEIGVIFDNSGNSRHPDDSPNDSPTAFFVQF